MSFSLLDPAQLEVYFAAWVQSLAATLQDGVVAVDGKVARGSHDQARGVSPLHLVSVCADEARLVLDQRRVDDRQGKCKVGFRAARRPGSRVVVRCGRAAAQWTHPFQASVASSVSCSGRSV